MLPNIVTSNNDEKQAQHDDMSCSTSCTVLMDKSWRSTTSEDIPQPDCHRKVMRRSSLKGPNTSPITPRPKRPSITFCEKVEVTPIVPTTNLIRKKSELWLRTKDYERIIARLMNILDQAEEGPSSEHCTRGLENLMHDTTVRYDAWDAVLGVQDTQRENGVLNDEELSSIYRLSCANSIEEAKIRALQDEKDAKGYLQGIVLA